jgi:hypothetical protein
MKELIEIQSELKAPKSQYNKFGQYNYRNVEDILEAVKPLLLKADCQLKLTDEIVMIGNRIYVKATAEFKNSAGEIETTQSFAREEETKKGMDSSQITGSASSYARKYALNGLFLIDDTKDSDATNTHGKDEQPTAPAKPKLDTDSENYTMALNAVTNGSFTVAKIKSKYELTPAAEKALTEAETGFKAQTK